MDVTYEWRGKFRNDELNALHAEGFGHRVLEDDWAAQVERHSLGVSMPITRAGNVGPVPVDGPVPLPRSTTRRAARGAAAE